MAWLFFLGGLAANYHALVKSGPSGLGFIPGVAGSITVFFSIPALAGHGIEVPWPWLWILLPLVVDPYCLGGLLLLLLRK